MSVRDVVLVHGAWHGGWVWDGVVPLLEARGLAAHVVDLPSSRPVQRGDLEADVALVRETVLALGRPVTLVGHSYGGTVISGASAGLEVVSHLVYVAAFMLPEELSLFTATGGEIPAWQTVDEAAGVVTLNDPVGALYGGCPPELVDAAVARLRPQSIASIVQANVNVGWHDHPSTYVICTQDGAIPPVAQEQMSTAASSVVRLECSHSPFLCHPASVADIIASVLA